MQKKQNFFDDNSDIAFHLDKRIDWDALWAWTSDDVRESFGVASAAELPGMVKEVLSTFGEICGTTIAPNARKVEEEGLELKDGEVHFPETIQKNIAALLEFGVASLGISPRYGGMGSAFFLEASAIEMIMRACPSTQMNIVWFSSIAHIIDHFGSQEIKDEVLPKIASGEWSGCMALTEADAGSDLAAMRSYGEKQPDGSYKLYGSKRFISNGNGQVALVLAKDSKDGEGLECLNLYMCLRKVDGRDNYRVTKLEEKVGLHGSATCELAFDGSDAVLIGEEQQGFKHMLILMNEARIAVGYQGIGVMEGAYRLAADYASQRKAWGKPIAQHEMIAETLLDMEVDIKALRSLCYQAAFNFSMMEAGEAKLRDKNLPESERTTIAKKVGKYRKRVRRWTPLIKWYAGERSYSIARDSLQVLGGYGFTTEYRAEWWVRESLIIAIYEGTSHIQALMCVKDTMKEVIRQPRAFVEYFMGYKMKALSEGNRLRKSLYRGKQLINGAILAILMRMLKANVRDSFADLKPTDIRRLVKILSRDLVKMENISPALLHAGRLCEMKALVCLAECLVWDAETDPSREWVAERFLNRSMPRLEMLKAEIEADDPVISSRIATFSSAASEAAAAASS